MSDKPKSSAHLGTPEYVAFLLMEKINERERMQRDPVLYSECLRAAYGLRSSKED